MLMTIGLIAGGFVCLYLGGEWLVRGAGDLALRLGMSSFMVGMTVVAFATSSPELAVSLDAAFRGVHGVAVGNVVGSNICNIALVLGLAATIRPIKVEARVIAVDVPLLIVVTAGMALLLWNGQASRIEGLLLITGLVIFIWQNVRVARRERARVREEFEHAAPPPGKSPLADIGLVAAGIVALVGGGYLFVKGAVILAEMLNVAPAIISLSLVALGTSLPELATSLVATLKGEGDITAGNVIGSNFFNILGILGITAVIQPLDRAGVTLVDLTVMVGVTILLLPLMFSRRSIGRAEGVLLLVIYAGYLWWLAESGQVPGTV